MGMPMLIGAGVGALGSAAMGKSPFKGALLGGALGGIGGSAGLFGEAAQTAGAFGTGTGGLLSGLKGIAPEVASLGTGGYASGVGATALGNALTAPSILAGTGSSLTGAGMLNPATVASALETTPSVAGGLGASSMMDKAGAYLQNLPSNIGKSIVDNPISSANTVMNAMSTGQTAQTQQPQINLPQIKQGSFENVSSPVANAAPNIGQTKQNQIGLTNLYSQIAQTDLDKLRQFYPTYFG